MKRLPRASMGIAFWLLAGCNSDESCSGHGLCATGSLDGKWPTHKIPSKPVDEIVTLDGTSDLPCKHPALHDGARVRVQSCEGPTTGRYTGGVYVIRDLSGKLIYVATTSRGINTLEAPCLPPEITISRIDYGCPDQNDDPCAVAKLVPLRFTADTTIMLGEQQRCMLEARGTEYEVSVYRSLYLKSCGIHRDEFHDATFSICATN